MATSASQVTPNTQQLRQLFARYDTRHNSERRLQVPREVPLRMASVLIPLFYKDAELHVLLTIRHKDMPVHAGQVAFPGGMWEERDSDAVATALRETHEEVGIKPEEVEIIAVLPPSVVRPNILVTPVLGILCDGFSLDISTREVEMVFHIPLKRFLTADGRTRQVILSNSGVRFYAYHFKDNVNGQEVDTWGFTASQCFMVAIVTFQSDVTLCFYENGPISRENCFNTTVTQAIIDWWNPEAKL